MSQIKPTFRTKVMCVGVFLLVFQGEDCRMWSFAQPYKEAAIQDPSTHKDAQGVQEAVFSPDFAVLSPFLSAR